MKKIVFITSRFPFPLNKGDKLRAYNQIKSLSQTAEIHLISFSDQEPLKNEQEELLKYCTSINNYRFSKLRRFLGLIQSIFMGLPYSVGYFYNRKVKRKVSDIISKINPDSIHAHLIRTAEYVPHHLECNTSIDFMDCFSMGAFKEKNSTKNILKKIFLSSEYKRLKKYENKAYSLFDTYCVISEMDKNNMPFFNSKPIKIIPNGVDFDVFHPVDSKKEYDLVFSGHMGYIPNIVAAKYAITQIHPRLKDKSLLIAGIGATPEIKSFNGGKIHVIEHFDHIKEAFYKSKILVAPMQISIGLQNKIIQAMAMKIPVVCSVSANESIKAANGKEILLANSPDDYANQISLLLENPKSYNDIADNAFKFVKENFNWDKINTQLAKLILNEQ